MSPTAIFLLSISMSTDAFAAAVGRGAAQRPDFAACVRGGIVFGLVEAITPVIGWSLGIIAADMVERFDHWIAFGLLVTVGSHMVWEASRRDGDDTATDLKPRSRARKAGKTALIATAVGTSIDAGAIGVSLAFIGVNIWIIAAAIGFTTFVCATMGLIIGKFVGERFGSMVEILGGILLIGIGSWILAEHTGLLS